MSTLLRGVALLVVAANFVASAAADEPQCGCPLQAALAKLPSLAFEVAGEVTSCDQSAAKLAEQQGEPIHYVVQQVFSDQSEAEQSLIAATEEMLAQLTTPSKCAISGTTTIGGKTIECPTAAAQVAAAVDKAVEAVQVSYKVGDKECNCPNQAKALAAESGAETLFVVNGEETSCPVTNQLNLARAKYHVALETINSAEACNEADGDKCPKCKGCPIEAAMKGLPQLAFVVGEETTTCAKHAGELKAKGAAPIQFAVRRTFADQHDATLYLVNATESLVKDFSTPVTCNKSGTTTVAGTKLDCPKTAAKIAQSINDAIDSVAVSFVVGDKECTCPHEAANLAEESGDETVYVVNGEKTTCELTNRLNVARAKYRAAVEALAKQASTAKKSNDSQS